MAVVLNPALASIGILVSAALLDYGLGDPWNWLHPVQVMGWVIQRYQNWVLSHLKAPWQLRLAGILLGLLLILGSATVVWLGLQVLRSFHPFLGWAAEVILLAACFAGRSLRMAALDVLQPLQDQRLEVARERLRRYVGRDTDNLTEPEVLRAVLETVTENATDAVLAPLFYALVGAAIPGLGSATLAIAYKAASTLDSMVGYREAPFTDLGWFSAQLEDRLTWLPCRLTVLTLALLSRQPRNVWQICCRDAPADPSPNSGWSEAAYAAILGVQVGGLNYYRGVAKPKPLLGNPTQAISHSTILRSLDLTRTCFLLSLGFGCFCLYFSRIVLYSVKLGNS